MKKVRFATLGCKLNFSETSTIARQFEEGGFARAGQGEAAGICIVNTCSVTDHADKKCRNLIRKLTRENPGAIVAVTGCYAQLKPHEVASIDGVDIVVGNNNKGELFGRVSELAGKTGAQIFSCDAGEITSFFAAFSTGDRTRSFLKVQDGCDYHCSYCTIPLARGGSRNIPVAEVVAGAREIAAKGQKEIVITGINTGDFGRTTGERFIDLLHELDGIGGIERYRISSIEPNLLTDEIIAFTKESQKFQPHFHIPLQAGSDRILGLMRRRYNSALFADRIRAVRAAMPGAFIGVDVIVGFPGETEDDFMCSYNLLKELEVSFLHVFPYSVRPNTPAAAMPGQVPPSESAARVKRLTGLSDDLHRNFCTRFIGTEAEVLFESTKKGGLMFGYTSNYIRCEAPYDRSSINRIVPVRLETFSEEGAMTTEIIMK